MKMSGGRLFQAGVLAFPKVRVCLGDRGIDSVTGTEWTMVGLGTDYNVVCWSL